MYKNPVQNNVATISSNCNMVVLATEQTTATNKTNKITKNKEKGDDVYKDYPRPTYGAYLYNSLPRGPYLQYKFYEQQQSIGHLKDNYDNNEQKQIQIHYQQQNDTQSAKDNLTLPKPYKTAAAITGCNWQNCPSSCCVKSQNLQCRSGLPQPNANLQLTAGDDCRDSQLVHRTETSSEKQYQLSNVITASTANTHRGYQTLPLRLKTNPLSGSSCRQIEAELLVTKRKFRSDESEIKSNHSNLRAAQQNGSDFLKQIQEKNSDMLARMAAAASHNSKGPIILPPSKQYESCPYPYERDDHSNKISLQSARSLSEFIRPMNNSSNSSSQVNYVTLADVIRVRSEGLNELEGWAILCQSVQALQDLFLADTPSTSRILPLVKPSTIQITNRGRIVFSLARVSQLNNLNDAASYHDITAHLSPEYLNSIGKKTFFAESDVEKMWIYSLGVTLRRAMKSTISTSMQTYQSQSKQNSTYLTTSKSHYNTVAVNNQVMMPILSSAHMDRYNHYAGAMDPNLELVTACMCEHSLQQRASLMYLLEFNPERVRLRRIPQQIASMKPEFDDSKFNFTKVDPQEKVIEIRNGKHTITLLINNSPLTLYHCLICPRIQDKLPQILTEDSIQSALKLLTLLHDKNFRIGYNSPGALASVNHLHLHLMYIQQDLFVDLAVISTFCRRQQQAKPFSHIVMDIFKEVVASVPNEKPLKSDRIYASQSDDIKSETDSGRGSAHGDKELAAGPTQFENVINNKNELRVISKDERPVKDVGYDKCSTIGYAGIKNLQPKDNFKTNQLQVRRRNNRQKSSAHNYRRKTIDVNLFDLERARLELLNEKCNENLNMSKSTNFIDKIVHFDNVNVERDDNVIRGVNKAASVANLKVRRDGIKGFHQIKKSYSDESFLLRPRGPEFIVKSSLPSRELNICDQKNHHQGVINVLLLDGQTVHITCNSSTTNAGEVFKALVISENYTENFFLGLCALIGGDFVFLPADLKVYKVAPQNWANKSNKTNTVNSIFFTLFLRIKFFLPTLRGISSLESRHMLYLQLRKSILEKHILCTEDDLISLGGLALQAEVGDFKESMKYSEYFTISHYLPEGVYHRNKEMGKYLRNSHFCRQGIHPKEAEQNFIKYIQEMKEYGFHLYSAIWATDNDSKMIDVYVGISLAGLALFERNTNPKANASTNSKIAYQRKLYMNFEWPEIENLCFSKHILCIVVRQTESLKAKDNNRIKYKLRMDGRKSYFAFSLASEHHQFYMKLRNSFISLKSLSDELNIPITSPSLGDKKSIGMGSCKISQNERNTNTSSNVLPENIKKIDKQLKASAVRVRNLKKSMLNDNRLLKLKEKFLRRSKSTAGIECKKKYDESERGDAHCQDNNINKFKSEQYTSKEESQNKENECPRIYLNDVSPKVYSPNRNRVKMGTRVFSSQFLNKSFDNIYDRTLNVQRFKSTTSMDRSQTDENEDEMQFEQKYFDAAGDGQSNRSASLNSLYGINKFSESPEAREAYVIHSSIKSDQVFGNNFSLPNETVSESLLEKFNNISCNTAENDRILTKLTVVKERFAAAQQDTEGLKIRRDSIKYATFGRKTGAVQHYLGAGNVDGKDPGYMASRRQSKGLWHLSKSQESIFIDNKFPMKNGPINQTSMENDLDGFTLGISIVQGSDNNVYVKDLVKNGPGEKAGIQIGDQIIAVNGRLLLNLSYDESLKLLQNSGLVVDLIVSQIIQTNKINKLLPHNSNTSKSIHKDLEHKNVTKIEKSSPKFFVKGRSKSINVTTTNHHEYLNNIRFEPDDICHRNDNEQKEIGIISSCCKAPDDGHNLLLTREKFKSAKSVNENLCPLIAAKSMPELPKVVAIIPKQKMELTERKKFSLPKANGNSRKYSGPIRYPVTPIKTIISPGKHQLSLLAESDDEQVFI